MRALASLFVGIFCLLFALPASAFCGFYVAGSDKGLFADASQVVLMRSGTRTVLSMQNDYRGPPEGFAMVVPVPVILQKENVKTLPKELFTKIDTLGSPRLVEYWEHDPCASDVLLEGASLTGGGFGGGGPGGGPVKRGTGVTVEAQFVVGEYEIVILSAKDAAGLETWLKEQKYAIPAGSEPYLRPYVQSGMRFFVAKVDPTKVKLEDGHIALSPLRFHYDADTFSLPVRLGLINSPGTQDLIVNILSENQRYEVANRPNVTIPTNLDVTASAKDRFAEFYAALFDKTVAENKNAVVTEYAWDTSTCDPCPGPSLTPGDLKTLGADKSPDGNFVLSRLHVRYSKESMGDDLVFRTAGAIVGGREQRGTDGALESGSAKAGTNNFQARYAIRHGWTGPVECKEPRRGRWGGPPSDAGPAPPTQAAQKTAFAPRGKLALASLIAGDAGAPAATGLDAGSSATAESPKKSGCGSCAIGAPSGTPFGLSIGLVIGFAALIRRRR